ncbi:translation initiation factor Sui1 [Chitinibacter sp. SCUT-21]|uniref:translation initiation factor Sui1 n=1 Tax=Chitinibacter sp. SCUT-21 TaxID=2970891 RepID=UPI0035A5FAFA
MKKSTQGGLVYSTEHGRMCPTCQQAIAQCTCKAAPKPSGDGIVRISREVRSGKTISVIRGVLLEAAELNKLGKELKNLCGTGGTVKDGVIEIQGDHRELIAKKLATRWTVKLAGG